MINARLRNVVRQRVHSRIRRKMSGTADRPRLNVYRSLNHIYTQLIDDANGVTIASASSMAKKSEGKNSEEKSSEEKSSEGKSSQGRKSGEKKSGGTVAAAATVGKLIAERAKEKGITRIVFDRGGYLYHGRIKALADAAREGGLDF